MDEKPSQEEQAPVQWVQGITAILGVAGRLAAKCGRRDLVRRLSATSKHQGTASFAPDVGESADLEADASGNADFGPDTTASEGA
ncbi:hypothetical protein [Saccharopolyspora hattusasensis]|uniref:hypothetical protein n=1 Tax=Saccharopolyspora hattusasensis TaxID=1128679 RepID=UPI003D993DF7